MKKKWWILIVGILLILLLILLSLIIYKNIEYSAKMDKINYTVQKYEAFSNNKISENDDELSNFFNKIVSEAQKQEDILDNKVTLDISDITKTMDNIKKDILEYDTKYLEDIENYNIESVITDNVDKNTILNIYQNNELIKNMNREKSKRQEYLDYLEDLEDVSEYLLDNAKYYSVLDKTISCKNKDIYNKMSDIISEYKLDYILKLDRIKKEVPILCYHGVLDNPWGAQTLFVKVSEFDRQMQYLKDNGYTPIFISEIEDAGMYEKPIIITFDDGYSDVYNYAFPILKKYNFKSNFFVISGFVGADVYVREDMIKEMSDSQLVEIGSHTVSHPLLGNLSAIDIEKEVSDSKEYLESIIQKEVNSIAYPSGNYNDTVLDIVKKYYDYGVSTDYGKEISTNINRYRLKRIYVYREYDLKQFKSLL